MRYLLQISIGPVQGFIAAARKTRDLKSGSDLLARLSKTAARSLAEQGANLIFPSDPEQPAANILLANLEGDPSTVSEAARARVLAELCRLVWETARSQPAASVVDPEADLDAQIHRVLEWFAVWTPMSDGYARARRRAATLMAARKAFRDFGPAPPEGDGRPKSPLDPAFAGVLKTELGGAVKRGSVVQLKQREHLDAVGVLKRFGNIGADEGRFPSTRTVAVGDLLWNEDGSPKPGVPELQRALQGQNEVDLGDALFDDLEGLDAGVTDVRRLAKAVRANPEFKLRSYYAILHGDGDGMGEFLDVLAHQPKGEELHRSFSRVLSDFANELKGVVYAHRGETIYAGGDDVVAFAPMRTSVAMAVTIRKLFADKASAWAATHLPGRAKLPTMTIGVAVVHVLENLLEAVQFAQSLEREGKRASFPGGRKDALVVGARPRGGADIFAKGRWDAGFADELERHRKLLSEGGLPRGFPYEIRALAMEIENLVAGRDALSEECLGELIEREVRRIIKKKETTGYSCPGWACRDASALAGYADLLLVAHFLTREGGE